MGTDHILYLTSTANFDIFPDNKPANFINRLPSPILLENNTEYEVGLVSILYPDQYYGILTGDDNYNITVFTNQQNVGVSSLTVKIHQNILAGNLEKIVKIVNRNLITHLKAHYGDIFKHIIPPKKGILRWNDEDSKVEINCHSKSTPKGLISNIKYVSIKMNTGIAQILGFNDNAEYNIFINDKSSSSVHKSPKNPSARCGVDYIYLYTDIIQPSNFGGQLVNILDCFSLHNGGNRGIHNSIYKPLNTHFIDQISIMVRDQYARPISFVDDSTLTCVIHIRPK